MWRRISSLFMIIHVLPLTVGLSRQQVPLSSDLIPTFTRVPRPVYLVPHIYNKRRCTTSTMATRETRENIPSDQMKDQKPNILLGGMGLVPKKTDGSHNFKSSRKSKEKIISSDQMMPSRKAKRVTPKKQKVKTMFRQAKEMERTGQWRQACDHLQKILEIDPYDSHSYLALARLQSRRERSTSTDCSSGDGGERSMVKNHNNFGDMTSQVDPLMIIRNERHSDARKVFFDGTKKCPGSIHLWQAWALHEQSLGNIVYARSLFQRALKIDSTNSYVCHGLGLLEERCGNFDKAIDCWRRPIRSKKGKSTAALVCSLGKLLVSKGKIHETRILYKNQVSKIASEREASEVYFAAAWLEEKHFRNITGAEELLNLSLQVSPGNSRALVALARLEGRKVALETQKKSQIVSRREETGNNVDNQDTLRRKNEVVKRRLVDACTKLVDERIKLGKSEELKSDVTDGRLFNAWADLEVKEKNFEKARNVLQTGRSLFPHDFSVS